MVFPVTRMRRYRKNSKIRDIVRETKLDKEDLIYPIFFKEELQGDEKEPIESMPGEYRYSLNKSILSQFVICKTLVSILLLNHLI